METVKLTLSLLAAITSLACMVLLFRAYLYRKVRLLLWSSLCFVGMSVNSLVLFLDLVIFPAMDLRPFRLTAALVGMLFLLYGFIWDAE
jgi:hypothetical protein